MTSKTRIRVAAAVTTLFVGGLVAFGVASRDPAGREVAVVEAAIKPKPNVVHRRQVTTVHPKRASAGAAGGAETAGAASAPAATPVVAPASAPAVVEAPVSNSEPAAVRTQTSPTGGSGDDDGYEHEESDDGSEHESEAG